MYLDAWGSDTFGISRAHTTRESTSAFPGNGVCLMSGSEFRPNTRRLEGERKSPSFFSRRFFPFDRPPTGSVSGTPLRSLALIHSAPPRRACPWRHRHRSQRPPVRPGANQPWESRFPGILLIKDGTMEHLIFDRPRPGNRMITLPRHNGSERQPEKNSTQHSLPDADSRHGDCFEKATWDITAACLHPRRSPPNPPIPAPVSGGPSASS